MCLDEKRMGPKELAQDYPRFGSSPLEAHGSVLGRFIHSLSRQVGKVSSYALHALHHPTTQSAANWINILGSKAQGMASEAEFRWT